MPDRTAHSPSTPADRPGRLRNIALVGAGGAGKTTLAEALAVAAGALTRPGTVPDGTTAADWEDIEHQQQRSVQFALLPLPWQDLTVNVLDAPGYADFAGELHAALRAAEAAVFVHSAADESVPRPVRALWQECEEARLPRAVALTHLNTARVRLDDVLRMLQDTLGTPDTVRLLHHPDLRDGHLHGTTDLLTGRSYGKPDDPGDLGAERARLIEALAGEDDTLMQRYLDGAELDTAALTAGLRREILAGTLHPVLATAPTAPAAMPCSTWSPPPSRPPPTAPTASRRRPRRALHRPGRPDRRGPLPRPPQPAAGLHRHPAPRHRRPPPRRHRGTPHRPAQPLRPPAAPRPAGRRRRPRHGRQAHRGPHRGHPHRRQHRAAALAAARSAAAHRRPGPLQGRRGQALPGPRPARRPGPGAARRTEPRHPPARPVVHRRGPPRRHPRPAHRPARRPRRDRSLRGRAPGDLRRPRQRPRTARQAVRRTRPVRDLRPHRRTPARRRLRVRRPGGRRRSPPALRPVGREGRPRPARPRPARPPDDRRPGHPHRRQGALGRLLRRRLPDRGPTRPQGGRRPHRGPRPGTRRRSPRPAARRVPGRRPHRPVRTPRPRPRHRDRRPRPEPGPRRGPRTRTRPVPARPALAVARNRPVHPQLPAARPHARPPRRPVRHHGLTRRQEPQERRGSAHALVPPGIWSRCRATQRYSTSASGRTGASANRPPAHAHRPPERISSRATACEPPYTLRSGVIHSTSRDARSSVTSPPVNSPSAAMSANWNATACQPAEDRLCRG
ncbi:hypothetical protein KCH_14260 [Kitasatospora cheerisanensis KCTC 2395]|uniref:Tr-type G domain-containing protein n=1 Tax=Kitasatospora cheerisanensis KCTC 2395 TaxID=1348663 RepID=A0A066Z8Z4_9ACTN|nr:hypothetical protein KCH_14260 [Kitasatospora cheerisanensis KCTC 2395]